MSYLARCPNCQSPELENIADVFEVNSLSDLQAWPSYDWCPNCGTMVNQSSGDVKVPKLAETETQQ